MSYSPIQKSRPTSKDYASLFVGLDILVPTLNGQKKRYINFDNAASTPPLKNVQQAVNDFMDYYSSVHRGTGFKSQFATHIYEETRDIVLAFLGANPEMFTCIFVKNTTEALNKLARRFPAENGRDIFLTTAMEHHSNDLPWRNIGHTLHVKVTPDGRLDEKDFDDKLAAYGDRIALVTVTGASNVTGNINPVHRLAEKAHAVGAQIAVDCAQLAPHRKVNMGSLDDPDHFDFAAISAHKMYAPYGTGALIARKDMLSKGDPDVVGGGTVDIVTLDHIVWAGLPDRDEAGSPNTAGAVALAAAIQQLQGVGMDAVASHEAELTSYALKKLAEIPKIQLFGNTDPAKARERLGVIPFNVQGMSHFLVASILGHEFGIGVRNGCFCAHPYILHILGLTSKEQKEASDRILAKDKRDMPGLVRISFGLYNSLDEVDIFIEVLQRIVKGEYSGRYIQDMESGEYRAESWQPEFDKFFRFI